MNKKALLTKIAEVANVLDDLNMTKEAKVFDKILIKLSARGRAAYDENSSIPWTEKNDELANKIAAEIGRIQEMEEEERWARQDDDYYRDEDETGYDKIQSELRRHQIDAQLNFLKNKLAELGFRMERPYEHWGEEESYMQYMEQDRFDGRDY